MSNNTWKKFFIIGALAVSSLVTVLASNTTVMIEIQPSKVANLYYVVLENGLAIKEDIPFELIDTKDNIILEISTQNSVLMIENIPFGDYILKPKNRNKTFEIIINDEYLKTQHLLKPLEIGINSMQTGDQNAIVPISILFILSGLVLVLRKEDKNENF